MKLHITIAINKLPENKTKPNNVFNTIITLSIYLTKYNIPYPVSQIIPIQFACLIPLLTGPIPNQDNPSHIIHLNDK